MKANTNAAVFPLKAELESKRKRGELPHVKAVQSSHPGKDIERGRQALSDGALYIYPSGSRINDVAGKGRVIDVEKGIALTICVSMKSANNEDAINAVGEWEAAMLGYLPNLKLPPVTDGSTKTILGAFEIDKETRELYQDGFYFYSIRVFTKIKIQQEN